MGQEKEGAGPKSRAPRGHLQGSRQPLLNSHRPVEVCLRPRIGLARALKNSSGAIQIVFVTDKAEDFPYCSRAGVRLTRRNAKKPRRPLGTARGPRRRCKQPLPERTPVTQFSARRAAGHATQSAALLIRCTSKCPNVKQHLTDLPREPAGTRSAKCSRTKVRAIAGENDH